MRKCKVDVRPAFFYTKAFVDNYVANCLIITNFYILLFRVPQSTGEVSRMDAQNFLRYMWVKNAPLYIPYLLVLVMS